jgi:tRNA pseudouridine13 synthase
VAWKQAPEHFRVDEIPLAEPTGSGEYLIVEVCKRNLTTPSLVRAIAQHFGISPSSVGSAGYKDRLAVTRQRLSLPASVVSSTPELDGLLEWRTLGLDEAPLRPGNLRGNRFQVLLGGMTAAQHQWLQSAWTRQQAVGWANYYGIQRFGPQNSNWQAGLEMLRHPPPKRERQRWPHNFVLNSVQAQLFNQFLQSRIAAGRFQSLRRGDWCDTPAGVRQVQGTAAERASMLAFQITPLGPIWGYKLENPTAEELALLEPLHLTQQSFRPFRAPGSRRALRLPLPSLTSHAREDGVELTFELPPGSYATTLLQHFCELRGGEEP